MGGRFGWRDVPAYVVTQVVGTAIDGAVLLAVASGRDGYTFLAAAIIEVVLTAVFVWIIMGATDDCAPVGFAPWPSAWA